MFLLDVVGLALKCHVCTSGDKYDGDACKNLKTDEFVTDCAEKSLSTGLNYTYCRKLDQDGKHPFPELLDNQDMPFLSFQESFGYLVIDHVH